MRRKEVLGLIERGGNFVVDAFIEFAPIMGGAVIGYMYGNIEHAASLGAFVGTVAGKEVSVYTNLQVPASGSNPSLSRVEMEPRSTNGSQRRRIL